MFGCLVSIAEDYGAFATGASKTLPIHIRRGDDLQSLNLRGLYPAGEGAGYAGGILSAAVDGIRVGEAVAQAVLGQPMPLENA